MHYNQDRILTTHVGSLPRPASVESLLVKMEHGEGYDEAAMEQEISTAVAQSVMEQRDWGIDIVNDGEMSKTGYSTYVQQRLSGFSGESPSLRFDDLSPFPDYRRLQASAAGTRRLVRPCCTGPIRVHDEQPLKRDIQNLTDATEHSDAVDVFMNAASPGVVSLFHTNRFYPDDDEYLEALAAVMRREYEAIHAAGLMLQIDCPDLAMGRHTQFRELSATDFLKRATVQVEVLNAALVNIPANRVRMHVCWGNYEGPHHLDIPLEQLFDTLMAAKPNGLLIESSNPRHAHEWELFRSRSLPDEKVLIPGVIDSVTNYIEHPELVAQRIIRFADLVGRERVIAGTDCGFATFAGIGKVDPAIAVEKFKSLVAGSAIASRKLWRSA
ncbi:MAG TPA: epoxyalkane--coenzyme M transferase [Gammaproteobacteria bacterium]|nr:epoxyalkane--coenzyme M transferase [Gammaproteobacteria bacterium]HIA88169.1 epoxyalkane--coenzyme M transferase [Gammaproteobacteria bacterium]HIC26337.1 epoxyalkane--coenzyme M transferase [Gammaproteobacteria bacterium]HIM71298.1 epoxyalkane--coenzyme M transferase [Gammaproteobacteria bacterium]HIN18333.1 epoxyalkane--coenzyme M transferase [Gammaproteobacteria bacterium]